MRPLRWTPGASGYLVAVLVSIGITSLGIALEVLVVAGPQQAMAALVVGLVYATLGAVPSAPLGVLLVHLSCRGVRLQTVHVLAAGVVGVLTGIAFSLGIDLGSSVLGTMSLSVLLGIATAVGRAAVIPLVPGVRARRRPVDDDFRPQATTR